MLKPWLSMMQDGDTITDKVERAGLQANHNGQPVLRGRSSADSQSSGYGLWTMDYGLWTGKTRRPESDKESIPMVSPSTQVGP